ncbi:aminotransferase class V-fold PLP-dependent enzyme [Sessilibacter sp. MAH1]
MTSPIRLNRRCFLASTLGLLTTTSIPTFAATKLLEPYNFKETKNTNPSMLAKDESYWNGIAKYYDRTEGIINLEHGYWGKMSHPVQDFYLNAITTVNQQNSYYARKDFNQDMTSVNQMLANALNINSSEITLTRNASEGFHALIRQYKNLNSSDAVLWADIDYPSFKRGMQWLAESHNAKAIELKLPAQCSKADLIQIYTQAFKENPNIKIALLTHVSNQHGLKLPVKEITAEAKKHGIDVICDCAQSWGLVDFTLPELGVDLAVFNLHKWIGSPLGVGALYIKEGLLDKIAPFPGDAKPNTDTIAQRVHMATADFASFISVPMALDFHTKIGGKNKEARLKYLRSLWVNQLKENPNIEILGAIDEESTTGMGSFRIKGKASETEVKNLQKTLEEKYGVFTVVRDGLNSGYCIRVTPQIFTKTEDIQALINALRVESA